MRQFNKIKHVQSTTHEREKKHAPLELTTSAPLTHQYIGEIIYISQQQQQKNST